MNDSYKNLFKGIMFFLVIVVVLLVLSIVFHSCSSHKQATATVQEVVDVSAAACITTETAARTQWLSSLSLELDSFELIMPIPFGTDTAMALSEASDQSAGRPRSANVAVLRARRASVNKHDIAERNARRCAQQVDSVASHRTLDRTDHYARDMVGIAKPPNLKWLPWVILAALVIVTAARYFRSKKR